MQREPDDVSHELAYDQINDMEKRRIEELDKAGIDETEVLKNASEQLNTWTSYFNENVTRGKDDVNFTIRDQWTAIERSEFSRLFKPAMTSNKLYDPVKKLIGEERKNRPDIMVRSLTGKATQEQINLRSDLVRTISYQSQNDLVYQAGFKSALLLGYGAFQIVLEYESPMSFNKVIRYRIINDPTRCCWDSTAILPHKGDGNYCGRSYVLTRDEFFATYPYVTDPISFIDPYMLLDFQWQTKDTICIQEMYVKEWFPLIIYKLSNGEIVSKDQWKEREKRFENNLEYVEDRIVGDIVAKEIPKIINERQTQDYRIMQYQMIRNQILDFSLWPSKHLPIPFIDGDSYFIEGRQYTKSFIHEARDAQKLLNYSRSELAAELKNRRREQWLATPDNIIGYEQQWRNPETQTAALMAKPDPKTGMMPQKMPAWEISQGIFATSQAATQDLREVLGFSENEELQGRDISGKARRERKVEGSMSAYVYFDNLKQAVAQGGRVVNDLLDHIIGSDEVEMNITRRNGREDRVIINQKVGEKVINELVPGDYDIEIDAGPSFAVQKEMALEFLQQTLQAYPQAFPLIADLWAKNLDVQFMEQISERFKTMVPPEILAKEENKQLPPKPPSPQEQMMQLQQQMMQQEIELKAAQLQERAEELRLRQKKHELEEAELALEAHKLKIQKEKESKDHHAEMSKTDLDFTAKMAKILADTHKKPISGAR